MKIDWRELIADFLTLIFLLGSAIVALFLYAGLS